MTRTRAEEYRRLAQECLGLARSLSTKEGQVLLVDMAAHWFRLAEEQEKAAESQPAAQQQQQTQPKDDDKKE